MMKRILLINVLLGIFCHIYAQSPEKFTYQAVVRDSNGELVKNQPIGLQISILLGSTSGSVNYTETHTVQSNDNGLISIEIGTGDSSDEFSAIDWSTGSYFIKNEIDVTGGTNYTITSVSQLLSVPYALHSKTAESITGSIEEIEQLKQQISLMNNILIDAGMTGTVMDNDGNIYTTVTIGDQVWMKENLKTTTLNDGTAIELETESWGQQQYPAYCWYNNDKDTYKPDYGALYNWITVETDKLCPSGWHVPTDEDWEELITYVGGQSTAATKLKATGYDYWESPNTSATDEYGFSAYGGGYRTSSATFNSIKTEGIWWSSDEASETGGSVVRMNNTATNVGTSANSKGYGMSVRCIKD